MSLNTKNILKTLISFFTFAVILLSSSFSAYAQPSRLADPVTSTVPIDRTSPVPIYFKYGSVDSDINIQNAVATAVISNVDQPSETPAFEFVREGNQDIFNGDPSRPDTDPAPDAPGNCAAFNAPRYNIPSSFFSNNNMSGYGLQTAKNLAQPTAILTQKSTGCILLLVRLTSNAKVGDKVSIQFDWDAGPSPDLRPDQRPRIANVILEVVPGTQPAQSSTPPASQPAQSSTPPAISSSVRSAQVTSTTARSGGWELVAYLSVFALAVSAFIFIKNKKDLPDIDV
jgi:hypothetical protein